MRSQPIHPEVIIEVLQGNKVLKILEPLKLLRVQVFKQYPYLQQTTPEYEDYYLRHFVEAQLALVAIAKTNEKILAAITGIPLISDFGLMKEYQEKLLHIFQQENLDARQYYYCGEILAQQPYDLNTLKNLFSAIENQAKNWGYKYLCFLKMQETTEHPLKPKNYQDPEPIDKIGFTITRVKLNYTWPTIQSNDEVKDTEHEMVFWTKPIMK